MNYLVIDLEMCKVPKQYRRRNYKYAYETIQIGAVLLDEEYEVIGRLNQYVHPEFGVLDHFITELTGIKNCNIKHVPLLADALRHLIDWIGDREYKVYAWSGTDYMQIQHEICCKTIKDSKIDSFMEADRWIDYQEVYRKRFRLENVCSLEEAIVSCKLHVKGRLHDGLYDAVNTAKLIKKLEKNPGFEIETIDKESYLKSEPLNLSLGDIFAGLNLSCIA